MGFKTLFLLYITVPLPILATGFYLYTKYDKRIKLIFDHFIKYVQSRDVNYFGGKVIPCILWLSRWSVPSFYFALFTYLVHFFYVRIHPKLTHPYTWLYNILLVGLMLTFLLSVYTQPVRLTKQNSQLYNSNWPKDEVIFFEKDCTTCKLPKPARSKHCKYCGECVILYDHHCVWLNNCIGMGNFKWFYSFLVMNIIVLTYAMTILVPLLISEKDNFDELLLFILCSLFDAIIVWFLIMNIRMIGRGMTTNEQLKFESVQYLVSLGTLYRDEADGSYYEFLPEENVFVGMDLSDNKVQSVNRDNLKKVRSMYEIVNLYDQGSFLGNLKYFLKS